jgi:hypothetical protein
MRKSKTAIEKGEEGIRMTSGFLSGAIVCMEVLFTEMGDSGKGVNKGG